MPTLESGDNFAEYQAEAFDTGRVKQIPILVGFNSEEEMVWFREYSGCQIDYLLN